VSRRPRVVFTARDGVAADAEELAELAVTRGLLTGVAMSVQREADRVCLDH
jgi:hypothetical protein